MSRATHCLSGALMTAMIMGSQVLYAAGTDLMTAIREGDISSVRNLLRKKSDPDAGRADGTSPLALAVYRGDSDMVALLIKSGANVDAANDYGVTPLHLACLNASTDIIEELLDAGANPGLAKQTGETPLMSCASSGDARGVRLLLDHGADVDHIENREAQTALMWAVAERHPQVVEELLTAGADVNLRSRLMPAPEPYVINIEKGQSIWGANYPPTVRFQQSLGGFTALHFAAQQGDQKSAELLIRAGADINTSHPEHGSPLVIAVASGHENLARFLLSEGANPNITDAWGVTPLHYALHHGLLLLGGASGKPTDKVGWERPNLTSLIETLLDHGADPNAQIKYMFPFLDNPYLARSTTNPPMISPVGATPLHLAGISGDLEAMNLLEEVSDVGARTSGGATLFMLATGAGPEKRAYGPGAEDRAIEAAKLALELGAGSIEDRLTHLAEDGPRKGVKDGRTALHFAAYRGWKKMVRFLAEQGADLNAADRYGMTPLMIALGDPEGRYYRQIGDGDYDHRFRRPGVTPGTGENADMADLLISLGAEPFTGKYVDSSGL